MTEKKTATVNWPPMIGALAILATGIALIFLKHDTEGFALIGTAVGSFAPSPVSRGVR